MITGILIFGSCTSKSKVSIASSSSSTNVSQPYLAGIWKSKDGEAIESVCTDGKILYAAAGYDGLIVFVITNGTGLVKLRSIVTNSSVNNVFIQTIDNKKYCFITFGNPKNEGGFAIYMVSNPTNIRKIYFNNSIKQSRVNSIKLDKKFIYITDDFKGLSVFQYDKGFNNISFYTNVSFSGKIAVDIALDPKRPYAYIASKESGIYIVNLDFWQTNMVSEDSRIFWQCFLRYDGDYRVVPLFYPVSMDANVAPGVFETFKNVYKQQRRWGYGVENIPYFLFGFWKSEPLTAASTRTRPSPSIHACKRRIARVPRSVWLEPLSQTRRQGWLKAIAAW